jgi:hypothetical protein
MRGEGRKVGAEAGNVIQRMGEVHDWLGSRPVALGDWHTALTTYYAEYSKYLEEHPGDFDAAVDHGNRALREAHGTATLMGRPEFMRSNNAIVQSFAQLYGFFSHNLNKVYKIMWQSRDIWNGQKPLDIEGHWAGPMFGKVFAHVLWIAFIEHLITPAPDDKDESWAKSLFKGGVEWAGSNVPYVREFTRGLVNPAHPGEGGLIGTMIHQPAKVLNDLNKVATDPAAQGRLIADGAALLGMFHGIMPKAQEGRFGEYVWRYTHGLENPQGPWDAASGLWHGTTKGHSHTMAEWWNNTTLGRLVTPEPKYAPGSF